MSDHEHVEPKPPPADFVATYWFRIGIVGILAYIAVIFGFIIL